MNPSSSETSGLSLPPPVMNEQLPVSSEQGQYAEQAVEQAIALPERKVGAASPPAAFPAVPAYPMQPTASPTPVAADDTSSAQTGSLPVANDGDLIEKEWVNKAKQIVERTRDDPYRQSEELTAVKADYMKKRYNKAIKLSQ